MATERTILSAIALLRENIRADMAKVNALLQSNSYGLNTPRAEARVGTLVDTLKYIDDAFPITKEQTPSKLGAKP